MRKGVNSIRTRGALQGNKTPPPLTSVITPSVPSDPTNRCVRSYLQQMAGAKRCQSFLFLPSLPFPKLTPPFASPSCTHPFILIPPCSTPSPAPPSITPHPPPPLPAPPIPPLFPSPCTRLTDPAPQLRHCHQAALPPPSTYTPPSPSFSPPSLPLHPHPALDFMTLYPNSVTLSVRPPPPAPPTLHPPPPLPRTPTHLTLHSTSSPGAPVV